MLACEGKLWVSLGRRGSREAPPGGDQPAEGRPRGSGGAGPRVLSWAAARAWAPPRPGLWPESLPGLSNSPPQPSLLPDVVIRERGIPALGKLGTSDTTWESFKKSLKTTLSLLTPQGSQGRTWPPGEFPACLFD